MSELAQRRENRSALFGQTVLEGDDQGDGHGIGEVLKPA
jgi:hypothetical protein